MKYSIYLSDNLSHLQDDVKEYFKNGCTDFDVEDYCKAENLQYYKDDMCNYNIFKNEDDTNFILVLEIED